ncbi:DNA-binding transcriptional regulator, LysR family [Allopseudospirillum japonicum]|uniref:DNA-binding transcriptional regulator, LysR family n=1 Tax=Allopseudospirillum japonicum TaxID=64971 RepID=A0A1H6RB82_9GAMM|nr:LysR family transcriptional regulator [Allopseudospirillum japonicum]SEI48452.1 DNA-binding transcriptional regulator, LysR family [Allopseudospirillum japonicum]
MRLTDLTALRYFMLVAESGSFTQAAQHQGVAQPAVSMAIRKLEKQLDTQLLDRGEKRVRPTEEGQVLLTHLQKVWQELIYADQALHHMQGLLKGEVRIGIPSMLGSYYFPPILMAFKSKYPDLQLSVYEAGTRRLQALLLAGELDLGVIVADTPPTSLQTHTFLHEEMLVCVPQDHAFAAMLAVPYTEFFQEDLVLFKQGYFHRDYIEALSKEVGIQPKIAFETNLIPLTKAIVRQGFGISTLLRMVIAEEAELVGIPFDPPVYLPLSLAWKKGAYLSRAHQAFIDFMLASTQTESKIKPAMP